MVPQFTLPYSTPGYPLVYLVLDLIPKTYAGLEPEGKIQQSATSVIRKLPRQNPIQSRRLTQKDYSHKSNSILVTSTLLFLRQYKIGLHQTLLCWQACPEIADWLCELPLLAVPEGQERHSCCHSSHVRLRASFGPVVLNLQQDMLSNGSRKPSDPISNRACNKLASLMSSGSGAFTRKEVPKRGSFFSAFFLEALLACLFSTRMRL